MQYIDTKGKVFLTTTTKNDYNGVQFFMIDYKNV